MVGFSWWIFQAEKVQRESYKYLNRKTIGPLIVCFRRTMEGSSPYPYDTILEKNFEPIFIMGHCYPQHRSQSWHLNHFCPKTRTFLRRLLHPISSNLKRG